MTDLELARRKLDAESLAFVLVRNGAVLAFGEDYGVRQLLAVIDRDIEAVRGASLADKVVGKAVALMAVHAGFREVYARLASESAVAFLRTAGIPLATSTVVPHISNRRGDGLCPMERLTQPFQEAGAGFDALRSFIIQRDGGLPTVAPVNRG